MEEREMVEINSTDYHDYVIKNGKLVGEFEQMYQKSKNVPWHQDGQENWLDIRLTVELLMEYSPFDSIIDFGCGLGYFLNILKKNVGSSKVKTTGYDISQTCCEKAKEIFPDFDFRVFDLMKDNEYNIIQSQEQTARNLFSIRGSLWYVFPKMGNVVKNISGITKKGDFLLVSQNFPPLENNFVGKDVIPTPEAIVEWFGSYFEPLKTIWLDDKKSQGNDNWFIGVFLRRGDKWGKD